MSLKIKTARCSYFRNNEHFQFHTEFRDLVTATTPATLNIAAQFADYLTRFDDEDVALQKISKSATTEQIEDADNVRDQTFRGMVETNKAALNHFDPDTVLAAKRLQIVFDTYGNVSRMPLNEETSAIYNLLQELDTNYLDDVQKVGLNDWRLVLRAQNAKFSALVKSRNDDSAARTELNMKEARVETDRAYNVIVTRINALVVVEGAANYETFIKKLNSYVEKYNNTVAQRQGRNKAAAL